MRLADDAPAAGEPHPERKRPLIGSSRLTLAIFLNIGWMVSYLNRVNLSSAMVGSGGIAAYKQWDDATKGLVLSAFFYGYAPCQLPIGWLACKVGPKRVLLTAFVSQGLLSLVFPWAVQWGVAPAMAARAALGVAQAALAPCMFHVLAAWLPAAESSRCFALADLGGVLGAAIALAGTPWLMRLWGWPAAFHVPAIASWMWALACQLVLWDAPELHPRIDERELRYLLAHVPKRTAASPKRPVPWVELICRRQLIALLFVEFTANYSAYVMLTFLPQYLTSQLHYKMAAGGMLATLPFLAQAAGQIISGSLADRLISSGLSLTATRKLIHLVGTLSPLALIAASYASNPPVAVAFLTTSNFFFAWFISGALIVPMHLSQEYTGILGGLANGFGNLAGAVAPAVTGAILAVGRCPTGEQEPISAACHSAWTSAFFVSVACSVLGIAVFLLFGSAQKIVLTGAPAEAPSGGGSEEQQGLEAACTAGPRSTSTRNS